MGIDYSLVPNEVQTEHINTLEKAKFFVDADGYLKLRTSASGTMQTAGLSIAGNISKVTINQTTWTQILVIPLTQCNAIAIQNNNAQNVLLQYDTNGNPNTLGLTHGITIVAYGERFYNIKGTVSSTIWLKSATSSIDIVIEELS